MDKFHILSASINLFIYTLNGQIEFARQDHQMVKCERNLSRPTDRKFLATDLSDYCLTTYVPRPVYKYSLSPDMNLYSENRKNGTISSPIPLHIPFFPEDKFNDRSSFFYGTSPFTGRSLSCYALSCDLVFTSLSVSIDQPDYLAHSRREAMKRE